MYQLTDSGVSRSRSRKRYHVILQGYRGVMATKDIPADVVLVRVARKCCIGPQTTDVSKEDWKRAMASAVDAVSTTDKFG